MVCFSDFYWRETGAKEGDFPLQTAMIGSRRGRRTTKISTTYVLRPRLPRLGSGMGSCFCFLSRRLQHLRKYIFNRLRRNLQSLKTWSVRLWDVVFPHQFDLISPPKQAQARSSTGGPRVRIHLPPAASQERTGGRRSRLAEPERILPDRAR